MVGQTARDRINSGIKVKICSILFLHLKERWFTMADTRLQETQPGYNKGQDAIASNWRGNR